MPNFKIALKYKKIKVLLPSLTPWWRCKHWWVLLWVNIFALHCFVYFFSSQNNMGLSHALEIWKMHLYMWNDGQYLLWRHIFYQDVDNGLKLLPRLSYVNLTPKSVMWVNLASQVLGASVAAVLKMYGSPETAATAKLCKMVNVTSHAKTYTNGFPFNS